MNHQSVEQDVTNLSLIDHLGVLSDSVAESRESDLNPIQ